MQHARVPVLPVSAAVLAAFNAVMPVFLAFGVGITAEQQAGLSSAVNGVVILVVAISHALRATRAERERWSHMNGASR